MPTKIHGLRLIAIASVIFIAAWPSTSSAADPIFAKSYALVIGIDRYQHAKWPSLSYARKDAEAMATFLEGQGYEVRTLLDSTATRARILREMTTYLARRLTPDDRVLIFFSGHGETQEFAGQDFGYVIPQDGSDDVTSWISMAAIREASRQMSNARHQLFIFDSCYGGQFGDKGLLSSIPTDHPRYIEKISGNKARQYITAGGKGERVRDGGPDGYSYFTGYLLRALSGKADLDGDSYVTSSELDAYLKPAASNWDHTPIAGVMPGHEQGNFWFRVADEATASDLQLSSDFWVGIDRMLFKSGDDGIKPIPASQRSIHSQLGDDVYAALPAQPKPMAQGPVCIKPDDLKVIRGVGLKTNDFLHSQGICTFSDLADLTVDSQIFRELGAINDNVHRSKDGPASWIEKARELAHED